MITVKQIFKIYGLNPSKITLVRHGNKEIPILDTFQNDFDRLVAYQSFQLPNRFGRDKNFIAVFAPYYNTKALFLGLWDIKGYLDNCKFTETIKLELNKYNLPMEWFENSGKYDLSKNDTLDDLSERLIIEWGRGTVAWVQSKDKEVVEIKMKKSIEEFQSFNLVNLTYKELQQLAQHPDSNRNWKQALSSVKGVYLIKDKLDCKLYVGSAYGQNGFYNRWCDYANSGHGGNEELKTLEPDNFQFSILEIASNTMTTDDIIECENRWKEKLGTREFGLNKN